MSEPSAPPSIDDLVFVGTHGHVVACSKADGKTVWQRSLPGTGYSIVSIVFEDERLLCASGGKVFALDPTNGAILWQNGLPGLGHGIVFLTTRHASGTERVMAMLAAAAGAQQRRQSGSA